MNELESLGSAFDKLLEATSGLLKLIESLNKWVDALERRLAPMHDLCGEWGQKRPETPIWNELGDATGLKW